MQQPVHEDDVGARARGEMHRRGPRDRRPPRIHTDHRRWIRAGEPIEDPRPCHRLRLGHVVSVESDDIGMVDVGVGAGLPVTPEGLLECGCRRRRAQPRVAVHVVGADATVTDEREGVVLLQEQLPGGVEADRTGAALVEQLLCTTGDGIHRGVPVGLDELAVAPDQRRGEPVLRVVRLPAEQVLGVEPTVVHPIHGASAHPHHAPVLDGDVEAVAVGMQDGRRLHPPVDIVLGQSVGEIGVDAGGPALPGSVGCARTPRIRDAIHGGHVPAVPGVGSTKHPARRRRQRSRFRRNNPANPTTDVRTSSYTFATLDLGSQ